MPILEDVLGRGIGEIRALFELNGLTLDQWDKARTDRVTVGGPAGRDLESKAASLRLVLADEDSGPAAGARNEDEAVA